MSQYRSTLIHTHASGEVSQEREALVQACVSYEERMKKASLSDMSIPESVLLFPAQTKAASLADYFREGGLKLCIVVGIGGSSLGTKAVYEALKDDADVELVFIESVDPERIRHALEEIALYKVEEIVCTFVSKSGETLETLIASDILVGTLREVFGQVVDTRIVVVTDMHSPLANKAKHHKWHMLPIPRHIGGRFSVLTAVGIFPLACAGIDCDKLIAGARGSTALFREGESDAAQTRAIELYGAYQSGVRAIALFVFDIRLYAFGVWYQALLAESLGKDKKGLLPVVMKGSDDLHALGQYLYDGPDIVSTHVFSSDCNIDIVRPDAVLCTTASAVHDAIRQAFVDTYTAKGRACVHTHVSGDVTPQAIGELIGEQMIMVMILGHLFGVNTFDQPGVEAYKEKARALITTRSGKVSQIKKS